MLFSYQHSLFEGIALDPNDIQVTIKMRSMGSDPSTGGTKANITITTNLIGNLVYAEEYYSPGSSGVQNFCCGSRYESIMNDYTISFDLKRPNHDHWQKWSLVKSKVLIDGVIVYEAWTGTGGTYRSFSPETSSIKNNSATNTGTITEQYGNIVSEDNNTGAKKNIGDIIQIYNGTNVERTNEKIPMIGLSAIIIVILSAYILRRMNI